MATRADELRRTLAEEIAAGALAPGEHLDEQRLAARHGVSRTPVREALRQLAATGLVESRPRRGVVVARLDPEELGETFEALAEIEGLTARWAALRAGAVERARLGALSIDADAPEPIAAAEAVHSEIATAARNASLSRAAREMRRRLAPYLATASGPAVAGLADVVAAIAAADADRAFERARARVLAIGVAATARAAASAD